MKLIRKLSKYWGDLPRHTRGINKGRVDRVAVGSLYGFTVEELTKAYLNWQDIFRIKGSALTYRQYLDKLAEAGLRPGNVGNEQGQFNLARYGDVGPYMNGSCRFILRVENIREQKRLFGRPVAA